MSAFAPLVGAKRNIDEHLSADDVRRMIDDARAKKDRDADKLGGNRKNSHRQKNPTPQHSRGELRVIGSSGRSSRPFYPSGAGCRWPRARGRGGRDQSSVDVPLVKARRHGPMAESSPASRVFPLWHCASALDR